MEGSVAGGGFDAAGVGAVVEVVVSGVDGALGAGAGVLAAVFEGGLIGAEAFAAFDAVDLLEAVLWAVTPVTFVTIVTWLLTAEGLLDVV